jgi:hypothetical protein
MKTNGYSKVFATALATVLTSMSLQAGEDMETPLPGMSWRIGSVSPARTEDWTDAWQTDLQLRLWHDANLALAVSVGFGNWTAREEYQESEEGDTLYATSVSGEATLIPVGASLLYRVPLSQHLACVLEGGLRYVFVNSEVTGRVGQLGPSGESIEERIIETDNFMQGVVSAMLEGSLADDIRLVGGIGYQFDLTAPQETYAGQPLGETSFDSLFFSIGLSWDF